MGKCWEERLKEEVPRGITNTEDILKWHLETDFSRCFLTHMHMKEKELVLPYNMKTMFLPDTID